MSDLLHSLRNSDARRGCKHPPSVSPPPLMLDADTQDDLLLAPFALDDDDDFDFDDDDLDDDDAFDDDDDDLDFDDDDLDFDGDDELDLDDDDDDLRLD